MARFLLLLALAGSAAADDLIRLDGTHRAAPDQRILIVENRRGDIDLRPSPDGVIVWRAMVQGASDAAPIRLRARGDTVALTVRRGAGRVDLAVLVPASLAVRARSGDGRIAARRLAGGVTARSDGGTLLASSHGHLDLATRGGAIRATPLGTKWNGPLRLRTRDGRIVATVPVDADLALAADTCGSIVARSPRFPVTGRGDCSRVRARFGDGLHAMSVRSRGGEIVLQARLELAR